jgi:hypothetical protein
MNFEWTIDWSVFVVSGLITTFPGQISFYLKARVIENCFEGFFWK